MGKSFIVNVCSISIGFILKIKRGTEFSTHILKKLLNIFFNDTMNARKF